MTEPATKNGAGYLLSHFLPRQVLRDARNLALQSERDELFKSYVLRKMWLVYPALLLFIVMSSACVVGVVSLLSILPARWGNFSLVLLLVLIPIVWFGGILSQLYLLFRWLEKKALRNADVAAAQVDLDPSSKRRRFGLPLAFAIFVVLPLGALAMYSSTVAMVLIACLLVAPIVLTLVED